MTARPYALTPDDRAAILENLAAGLHENKAHFGKAAVLLASRRLQQEDDAWRDAVRDATAEGARVREEQAEAMRPKLPREWVEECRATSTEQSQETPADIGGHPSEPSQFLTIAKTDAVSEDSETSDRSTWSAPTMPDSVHKQRSIQDASNGRDAPPARTPVPPEARARLAETLTGPSKRASEATDDGAPDWGRFRAQAEEAYGPGRMGLYMLQDERLIKGGLPPTSPWWLKTMNEFFDSGLTWLLAMVGRGAGKSTNLERLLQIVVLLTERDVPTGQTWQCPFMSVVEKDAYRRIAEIKHLLMLAFGLELNIRGQSIKVRDCCGNEIEIVSTAGTIGQTSGPTTVGVFFDEAAKMHTADGAANRDTELIASIVGTSREQSGLTGWVGVRCSSAWQTRGAHFANCMEGTNAENYVATIGIDFFDDAIAGYEIVARWEQAQGNAHGASQIRSFYKTLTPQSPNVATWVARPTLTALASRMKLETLPKDDPTLDGLSRFDYWIREYGSMPLSREGGPDFAEQCQFAARVTARLNGRTVGRRDPGTNENGLLIDPYAKPGDARYGGRERGPGALRVPRWKTRTI